ncbi:DUF4386 family protein [Clostridium estertheticum]|uniref:DUF4386 domain-containing protein n=1 Tax=Clostridium estertheticum TaxID=238834 RepID=A0AA47EPQ0_9CLOT|nr:DUF4386 family protein [Clostridium estertheticum]MBU3157626.1 DUF4386 domain-containing protein [Clostridium estertheticum]WAG63244.1 DUF4386 domain-containing protein [Clostridium estertheticum]
MDTIMFYKISGVFIILVALTFSIGQVGITKLFDYPQILRSSTNVILHKYHDGGTKLKFFWGCNALGGLMIIPMSAIFFKVLGRNDTPYLIVGATFGMASGIFYVLGFMRWLFLADSLSIQYVNKDTDSITKKTIEIIFKSFNIYCGNSIGETMGFLCMGIWLCISGISIFGSPLFPPFIGAALIICGIGILVGPLEWVGIKSSNKINKLSMKLLMLLLIYVGIRLITY